MRKIQLSNSDISVLVDSDDYPFLCRFSWFSKKSRRGNYACTSMRAGSRVLTFRMHRLIMRCFDDNTVDHLNEDHWDNRKENLEIVSMLENVKRYYDKTPF